MFCCVVLCCVVGPGTGNQRGDTFRVVSDYRLRDHFNTINRNYDNKSLKPHGYSTSLNALRTVDVCAVDDKTMTVVEYLSDQT